MIRVEDEILSSVNCKYVGFLIIVPSKFNTENEDHGHPCSSSQPASHTIAIGHNQNNNSY